MDPMQMLLQVLGLMNLPKLVKSLQEMGGPRLPIPPSVPGAPTLPMGAAPGMPPGMPPLSPALLMAAVQRAAGGAFPTRQPSAVPPGISPGIPQLTNLPL